MQLHYSLKCLNSMELHYAELVPTLLGAYMKRDLGPFQSNGMFSNHSEFLKKKIRKMTIAYQHDKQLQRWYILFILLAWHQASF